MASYYILILISGVACYIYILSAILSSVPAILYLCAFCHCDELHCMFNQIRLPQERWDFHLSSSDIPPQHVPCRCIEGTLQQIMFHSFLAVAAFTVWRFSPFKAM